MNTPAHQLPTVTEKTTVGARFTLAQWLVGGCTFAGGIIWLSTMHADVQSVKESQKKQAETLEMIRDTVREIEFRQKYGITAGLPRATP